MFLADPERPEICKAVLRNSRMERNKECCDGGCQMLFASTNVVT